MPPLPKKYITPYSPSSGAMVEAVEVVEVVEAVEEEVVEEDQYHHLGCPNLQDKMSLHHKEKLKPWDNSRASSQETEAKRTTLSMNFVATSD
jgi:hypothetical protein